MLAPVIGRPASSIQNIVSRYSCSATVACSAANFSSFLGAPNQDRLICKSLTAIQNSLRRHWPLYLGGLLVALLAWSALDAHGGTPEPTAGDHLSHGAVVLDSALLVFREGLETILVLAAVTASMVGATEVYRRPIAIGAGTGFLASVATWFLAAWVLGQLGGSGLAVQAATGLLAVIVLLVVMNWFFHKVYWTGWIAEPQPAQAGDPRAVGQSTGGGRRCGG